MRSRLTALAGALLLATTVTVPALRLALETDEPAAATASVQVAADDEADKSEEGHGPPAWAHAGGREKSKDGAKDKAWKSLTPSERHALMKRLVREHNAGMKAFAKCAAAGRDDCEKPLPPGQAKKL